MQKDLIDEYRIFINPVVSGGGKALSKGINNRFRFRLISSRAFRSGLMLLLYQPLHQE
jgi:dihydrofolate reductase